jgi:LPS export ABC transporter permease LptG
VKSVHWRYLLKVHLKTLIAVLSVVALIIFIFTFTETLRRMAGRATISLEFLSLIALYRLPYIMVVLFPYIYLVSVSLALEALASSRQLTVLRAGGYSMRQILSPFLWLAGVLSLTWFFIFQPFAARLYNEIQLKEQQHFGISSHSGTNLWLYQRSPAEPSILLHVARMQNNVCVDVSVYLFSEDGTLKEKIFARTLHFAPGAWILSHGTAFKKEGLEYQSFSERKIENTLDADRMLSSLTPPEDLGVYDLFSIVKVRKKNHLYEKEHILALHALGAKAVLIFLMVFVAGCFQKKHSRGKKSVSVAQTLLCGLFLHFFMDIFHSLGIKGVLAPFWAGWTSVLLTGAFSFACLSWKEER